MSIKTPFSQRLTVLLTCCGAALPAAQAANVTVAAGNSSALVSAIENAHDYDVITVQSGTFQLAGKAPISLKASNVTIVAFGAVLEFGATTGSDAGRGVEVNGSHNYIKGLTIKHAPDNGMYIDGSYNTVERCTFYANFDTGLQIQGTMYSSNHPGYNKVINCDSYANYDTKALGGNADGFAAKVNIGPGNSFTGCRAWDNSDDGWDLFPKEADGTYPVTITHCLSYHNGYHNGVAAGNGNGFKLGSDVTAGANHVIKNSIAVNNRSKGFDQNHNQGKVTVDHCSSANNLADEFSFYEFTNGGTFTKNVYAGTWNVQGTQSGNLSVSTSAFGSTNPSAATRDSNGNLLFNSLLKYSNSSAAGANP